MGWFDTPDAEKFMQELAAIAHMDPSVGEAIAVQSGRVEVCVEYRAGETVVMCECGKWRPEGKPHGGEASSSSSRSSS